MRSDVRRRLDAAELVRASLEADRVLVHYQVIVDLQTGTPAESEALVRLQDSDGRYVHPGEFIEVAEASGLIVPLGAAVLDLACAQQARWAASGSTLARVGVNISAHQLASPDLVDHVRRILAAHRLSGSQLCLELTESSLIDAGPATLAQVEELRGIGVTFAIDDFGTGWSSLSSLRRLPLDVMKIDRSFVSGLGRDEGDAEVVKALIGLSHSLGLTVVAEGVETAEQAAVLHRLGCERAQGHFYSRPQPAEDVRMTTPA